jgi:hypothetical protein
MSRPLAAPALALVLALALSAPAAAGGWAVTTFDSLPPQFEAGQKYILGYTIRQHAVTPISVDRTEIRITSADSGKTLTYRGSPDGAVGHYTAVVIFPYAGRWNWEVTQGPFEPQQLEPATVVAAGAAQAQAPAAAAPAAAGAPAQPASAPAGPNGLLVTAAILALAGAAMLFGSRAAALTGRAARA